MKEFSIEEKARRYDEALEWMKSVYPTLKGADKEDAEHYFPELTESKDEWIRKRLLDYFNCFTSNTFFNNVSTEDAIAWLEKQGEQKIDSDTLIQQRVDALADIVAEQKPTDKVEPKFHEGEWVTIKQ